MCFNFIMGMLLNKVGDNKFTRLSLPFSYCLHNSENRVMQLNDIGKNQGRKEREGRETISSLTKLGTCF